MVVGVARRIEVFQLFVFGQPVWLVIALPFLVLDHADLVIEFFLSDRTQQISHPVAFQHQRPVERAGGHGLEVICTVEPGGAVEIGCSDLLQRFEEITRRVFRPVEHQMFKQVGETGLAFRLVLGADIIPDRDPDHRSLAVFMHQNGQAVFQLEPFVGDRHCIDQFGHRRRIGACRLRVITARWQRGRNRNRLCRSRLAGRQR